MLVLPKALSHQPQPASCVEVNKDQGRMSYTRGHGQSRQSLPSSGEYLASPLSPLMCATALLTNTTRQRCYSQLPCCYSNWSPAVSCAIYSWAIVLWHYCQRACCTSISRTLKHPARRGATGLLSAAGRPEAADSLDPNVIRLPWRRSPLFFPMSESSPVPFIIVVHCQMSTVDYQSASVGSSVESRTTARLHRPRLLTLRRHGKTGSRWYRHRRSTLACRARTS